MTKIVSVTSYGAVGNGITDDTTAISNAIADLDTDGAVLIFPPGTYLTSGGFTLANPVTVAGGGMALNLSAGDVTTIQCNHATNSLFTVSAGMARFHNLDMINIAGSTPSAGAGVTIAGAQRQKVDFDSVSVRGFYINIDRQIGNFWTMRNCFIGNAIKYGLKIANTFNVDAGDWCISDTSIDCNNASATVADAAIRIESSGGGKIVNTKINGSGEKYTNGIDLAMGNGSTVILLIDNCSIENVAGNGINIAKTGTGTFKGISIRGTQFGFWNGAHGAMPISITADALGGIAGVTIIGNMVLRAPNAAVINLTNIDNVFIDGNVNLESTDLLAETTCTNVLQGSSA